MADTALGFVVQIRFPACSFRGSPQERTGLTIRSSRCHFTAAIFFGMFVLVCGRAVARLNSGVRFSAEFFGMCGLCIEFRLIGLLLGSSVPLRTWPTARRGPAHRGGGSIP